MNTLTVTLLSHPDPGYVRCPYCRATGWCQTWTGKPAAQYHADRATLAKALWQGYEAVNAQWPLPKGDHTIESA